MTDPAKVFAASYAEVEAQRDFARKGLRYLIERCEREYRDQDQPPELDFVILAVEEAKKAL